MTQIETNILTMTISAGVGMVAKIVWDWLKNGRGEKIGQTSGYGLKCVDHEACAISIAELRSITAQQAKALSKGDERMDQMMKDIAKIKTGVAVLVDRSRPHRVSGGYDVLGQGEGE